MYRLHVHVAQLNSIFAFHMLIAFTVNHCLTLLAALIQIKAFSHTILIALPFIMYVLSRFSSFTKYFRLFVQLQTVKVVHIFCLTRSTHQSFISPSLLFSFQNRIFQNVMKTQLYLTLLPFKV